MDRRKLVETCLKIFKRPKPEVLMYKNCEDLPIRRFDTIYKTKDLRYLCLYFTGYNDVEVPKEADNRWSLIFDEWMDLCDNNKVSYYYQLTLEITYLRTRYLISKELLKQIFTRYPSTMNENTLDLYITELKRWRYNYDKTQPMLKEIKRLMEQHKASENKLGIKEAELKSLQEENGDEEVQSLEAQAIILEQVTGVKTDLEKDSVKKWLELGKIATKINEQKRRNAKL